MLNIKCIRDTKENIIVRYNFYSYTLYFYTYTYRVINLKLLDKKYLNYFDVILSLITYSILC